MSSSSLSFHRKSGEKQVGAVLSANVSQASFFEELYLACFHLFQPPWGFILQLKVLPLNITNFNVY